MRIFLAGATGVIGRQLLPLLVKSGHEVAAMTRSTAKAPDITAAGAVPVVCDVFDRDALMEAVAAFAPEMVMHQLTDLPDDPALLADHLDRNARIRTEGTANLIDAGTAAGMSRLFAQSIAWTSTGSAEAVARHEQVVLDAKGVVARYGQFYGPGTFHPHDPPPAPRVHIDDAVRRTVEALEVPPGIITIVEGE